MSYNNVWRIIFVKIMLEKGDSVGMKRGQSWYILEVRYFLKKGAGLLHR